MVSSNIFLQVMNTFDNKLFTIKSKDNYIASFLDTRAIRHNNNQIHLDWYKNLHRVVALIFLLTTSSIVNQISFAMTSRIQRIRNPSLLNHALKRLTNIFSNNGYPWPLVNKHLFFLRSITVHSSVEYTERSRKVLRIFFLYFESFSKDFKLFHSTNMNN